MHPILANPARLAPALLTPALLALCLLWPGVLRAEEPTAGQRSEADRAVWTLALENDLTNDTDRYFTNGIRLSRTSPVGTVPESVVDAVRPLIGHIGSVRWTVGGGRNQYTPRHETRPRR